MNTQRFPFTGFALVRTADTKTHEVEVGRITQGDEVFIAHMIRKAGLPFEANFLVAQVFDQSESKSIWAFRNLSFEGIGVLAQAGDEIVIALVGKGRDGKVERVIPFSSFTATQPMDLRRTVELKRLAAKYLDRDYVLSGAENTVARRDLQQQRDTAEILRAREQEARLKARSELVTKIMARGPIEVYTSNGRRRHGLPVLSSEWPSLSSGMHVVLVESYDDETREMGTPIEAFQIVKEKGKNPKKGSPVLVTLERPAVIVQSAAEKIPQPAGSMIIEIEHKGVFEVAVYATMDDIRKARAGGLNGGTYVTARDRKNGDLYEVYSVHSDKVATLGLFQPIG